MAIEQRLAKAIRSFHLDVLSLSVALNVDLEVALTRVAHASYDLLRRQFAGYQHATSDTIWRRFVSTRGWNDRTLTIEIGPTDPTQGSIPCTRIQTNPRSHPSPR